MGMDEVVALARWDEEEAMTELSSLHLLSTETLWSRVR